jgi:hypothetical protein
MQVEYIQLDDGTCLPVSTEFLNYTQIKDDQIKFASHYNFVDHGLNLSNLGITESSLDAIFADLSSFINKNKVKFLLLDSNKFSDEDFEKISEQSNRLLENCYTLKIISLADNFELKPNLKYQWRPKLD